MPSTDTYKALPADVGEALRALDQHIHLADRNLPDFERRHLNGIREKALVYCLRHALDLAKGCATTAGGNLPDSLNTLSRSLMETLVWARYVTLSDHNAEMFSDMTLDQLKRVARKNVEAGFAHIFDSSTHEDRSHEFLHSSIMKNIPQRPRIEKVAGEVGLGRLYSTTYGFVSMYAHGTAYGLQSGAQTASEVYASVCAALGMMETINLVASDWIVHRRVTPMAMIHRLLGV